MVEKEGCDAGGQVVASGDLCPELEQKVQNLQKIRLAGGVGPEDSGKAKQFGAIGHGYHSVDRIVLGGFETEDGLVAEGQKVLESNFLYHIVSIVSGCKDTTFI